MYSHINKEALRVEWIQNHMQQHGCESALAALGAMDSDDAQVAATHVISGLLEDLGPDNGESLEAQQRSVSKTISLVSWMQTPKPQMLQNLNAIALLQERCLMCLGMRELATTGAREECLKCAYMATAASDGDMALSEVLHLADVLQLPRSVALRVVALEGVGVGSPYAALEACELLAQRFTMALPATNDLAKGEEMARVICQAATILLAYFHRQGSSWAEGNSNGGLPGSPSADVRRDVSQVIAMPLRLHKLLQGAAAVCSAESLPECIRMLSDTELALDILARCDLAAYETDAACEDDEDECNSSSSLQQYIGYRDQYREDSCVLPLAETMQQMALARYEMLSIESQQLEERAKLESIPDPNDEADDAETSDGDETDEEVDEEECLGPDATIGLVDYLGKLGANQSAIRYGASLMLSYAIDCFAASPALACSLNSVTTNLVSKALRARQHDSTLALGYLLLQGQEADMDQAQQLAVQCSAGNTANWKRAACLLQTCVATTLRFHDSATPVVNEDSESVQDWSKLTVVKLKAELTARGAATDGKKADLVARLEEIVNSSSTSEGADGSEHSACQLYCDLWQRASMMCKLHELNISTSAFAGVLACNADGQAAAIPRSAVENTVMAMLAHVECGTELCVRFGQQFGMTADECSLLVAEGALLSPRDDWQELALGVIDELNPKVLGKMIKSKVLLKANAYDYDRLVFLLRMLKHCSSDSGTQELCKRSVVMLEEVLLVYERTTAPNDDERAEFGESALAATRLPFHAMVKADEEVALFAQVCVNTEC